MDRSIGLVVETLRRLMFRKLELPGDENSIRRILIFRIGSVGDVVAAIPTLGAIRRRFPNAHICLLTSPGGQGAPGAQELIRPGSLVDSLVVYHQPDISTWGGRKRLARKVRSGQFDLYIEIPDVLAPFRRTMQSMMLARIAGCRYAVGFQMGGSRRFSRTQALHGTFQRESDRLLYKVRGVLDLKPSNSVRLPVSAADHDFVRELLLEKGLAANHEIVVLHVGGKRAANCWFEERYAAVADWIQTSCGMRTVFTGVASERERIHQVRRQMRTQPIIVCGELNLLQTAALLERARLYVGNDTGPMHIAAAMGTPVVAIFSARDFPQQWYPQGDGHVVLRRDVPCSPCFQDLCDRGLACLDLIQIETVRNAVQLQLSRRHAAAAPTREAVEDSAVDSLEA
jgi:heptosyltransferase-1